MTAVPETVTNEDFLRALFGEDWPQAHVTAFHGDPNDGGISNAAIQRFSGEIPTPANFQGSTIPMAYAAD